MEDADLLLDDISARTSMDERAKSRRSSRKHDAAAEDYVNGVHYAFANIKKVFPPPRQRHRPKFQPFRINTALFLVCRVRPFPEWPLICKRDSYLAFDDESAAKKWLAKHGEPSIFRIWTCDFCAKVHVICYPHEITGNSSGKSFRKDSMKESYNGTV